MERTSARIISDPSGDVSPRPPPPPPAAAEATIADSFCACSDRKLVKHLARQRACATRCCGRAFRRSHSRTRPCRRRRRSRSRQRAYPAHRWSANFAGCPGRFAYAIASPRDERQQRGEPVLVVFLQQSLREVLLDADDTIVRASRNVGVHRPEHAEVTRNIVEELGLASIPIRGTAPSSGRPIAARACARSCATDRTGVSERY